MYSSVNFCSVHNICIPRSKHKGWYFRLSVKKVLTDKVIFEQKNKASRRASKQFPEEIITLYFIWNFQWFEYAIYYLGNCSHPEETVYVRCIGVWRCDAFKLPFMCHNTVSPSLSEEMSPYLTIVLHSRQGAWEFVLLFISRNPLYTHHPQRDHLHVPVLQPGNSALISHTSLQQRTRVLSCLFMLCLLLQRLLHFGRSRPLPLPLLCQRNSRYVFSF